jgi:acetyl coenzyme A synthetase (ADP forming)-like protein
VVGVYPAHRETDVALRDGSTLHVRPLRPEDREALLSFFRGLSEEARGFRFFSPTADLDDATALAVDIDYRDRYGLVATRGQEPRIVGHAVYFGAGDSRAEIAFAIADELQGHGLGTILLAHLAEVAEDAGIEVFEAEVLPANHRMLEVFRESGFPVEVTSEPDGVRARFPTSFSAEAVERFERREEIAAAAAMRHFLNPGSVAVIGASRQRGTVGGEIFHNLLEVGFNGPVYPVNANAEVVQSVRAYPTIVDVPGDVELAVVAVPAPGVSDVVRTCADKGVRAMVVVSAGFAEVDEQGAARQREVLEICRATGIRLIGPNCLGIINTADDVRLNATFAPSSARAGRVAFVSQSGALGLALIELAGGRDLGLSSFASVGNKADISGNDLLSYWTDDPGTDVALLYLESFGNPRRFSTIARRMGADKPIVAVKAGRSQAGARATSSHTGALLAASDVTVDALFRQAGVIRTDSLGEMLDVASLLQSQPLPAGRRVTIVTNAGGPGIMCADACEAAGLDVPPLPNDVQRELSGFLAPEASVVNPVDMIATASAEQYGRAIGALAACNELDALIVIFVRPLLTRAEDVAAAIGGAVEGLSRELPVLAVFMSAERQPTPGGEGGIAVPRFQYPEDAARAMARAALYAEWRRRPVESAIEPDGLRKEEAAAVIAEALADGAGWLELTRLARLLDCYGIPMAGWRVAPSPAEVGAAAQELGGPVAVKALGGELLHKTELGAVRLGLASPLEAEGAAVEIDAALEAAGRARDAFLVQGMIESGVEMLIGVVGDPVFGPVVACGAGGVQAELLQDVSVRLTPVSDRDAREMIRSLRTLPLLTGYRGGPEADLDALEGILLRVGALVESHREVAELDLNPVVARPDGAVVVDARVRIESAPPPAPWPRAK